MVILAIGSHGGTSLIRVGSCAFNFYFTIVRNLTTLRLFPFLYHQKYTRSFWRLKNRLSWLGLEGSWKLHSLEIIRAAVCGTVSYHRFKKLHHVSEEGRDTTICSCGEESGISLGGMIDGLGLL